MKKLNRLYLGTNTKMYKTIAETTSFLTQLRQLTEDLADSPLTLFVIPSFTSLESANRITSAACNTLSLTNGVEPDGYALVCKVSWHYKTDTV